MTPRTVSKRINKGMTSNSRKSCTFENPSPGEDNLYGCTKIVSLADHCADDESQGIYRNPKREDDVYLRHNLLNGCRLETLHYACTAFLDQQKNTTTRITENGIVTSSACMMSQSCTLMTGRGNSSSVTTSFSLWTPVFVFSVTASALAAAAVAVRGCCTPVTRSVSLVSRAALVAARHTLRRPRAVRRCGPLSIRTQFTSFLFFAA